MTSEMMERESRALAYIAKVDRRMARKEAREIRRCERIADGLWNAALIVASTVVGMAVLLL